MSAHSNRPHFTGAFELFSKSKEAVLQNRKTFAILYILPFISVIVGFFSDAWNGGGTRVTGPSNIGSVPTHVVAGIAGIGILLVLLLIVGGLILETMTYGLEVESAAGKRPSLKHLFNIGKKHWLRMLGLLIVAGFLIIGGLILLIVPGLIAIQRFFVAPYVMVDKNLGIVDSLRESSRLTKGHAGAIWGIIGVMILISLLGIIPPVGSLLSFGVGLLYSVAPAIRYHELKNS